jgi:hypothetical protein
MLIFTAPKKEKKGKSQKKPKTPSISSNPFLSPNLLPQDKDA